jgi:hypothetical protein
MQEKLKKYNFQNLKFFKIPYLRLHGIVEKRTTNFPVIILEEYPLIKLFYSEI